MGFKLCLAIPTHDNRVYYEFMKSFTAVILYSEFFKYMFGHDKVFYLYLSVMSVLYKQDI